MSIIRNIDLTLETIVSLSNLIVEAETVEPFEELIPIPSDNKDRVLPDFIKTGMIFKVKSILKNTSDNFIPALIRVPNENWRRRFSHHKERYANGVSKSFTVNKYISKVSSIKEAKILFLNCYSDDFSLTAHNAYELQDSLQKVIEMINNQ